MTTELATAPAPETRSERLLAPPPPPPEPAFWVHKGKLLARQDLGLWTGLIPVEMPPAADSPEIRWRGGKLPLRLILQLLAFFRHVNKTHRSEAQARLAYNPATREWRALVLPQHVGTGMVSNELKHPTAAEQEQKNLILEAGLEGGFMLCGTAHSHCDSGAFASYTDDNDEITQTGLHFTLGKVSGFGPELHGRVVFRGVKYAIDWSDWVAEWPETRDPKRDSFHLNLPKDYPLPDYPELWTKACLVKPAETYGRGYGFGDTTDYSGRGTWTGKDRENAPKEYWKNRVYNNTMLRMETVDEWRARTTAELNPPQDYYRERNWIPELQRTESPAEWRERLRVEAVAEAKKAKEEAKALKKAEKRARREEKGAFGESSETRKRIWTSALRAARNRLLKTGESQLFADCVLRRALASKGSDPQFTISDLRDLTEDALAAFVTLYNAALDVGDSLSLDAMTVCAALEESLGTTLDARTLPFSEEVPAEVLEDPAKPPAATTPTQTDMDDYGGLD